MHNPRMLVEDIFQWLTITPNLHPADYQNFHLHEILRTMLAEPPQINTIISLSGLGDS
jgi:hypothetical protein